MNKSTVYGIIINWNGKKDTEECLSSLEIVHTANPLLSIVVVDNGSHDGSAKYIQKKFPWIICISLEKNIGFAGATNIGIRYALEKNATYVWFLNNDTIVDRKVLTALHAFDDQSVGAVGSKIYFYKGQEFHKNRYAKKDLGHVVWYAGGYIDWKNMYADHVGVDIVDIGQFNQEQETQFVTGCSFFVRSNVVQKVGMLDETLGMYLEDVDYSLRIQKSGYKTMFYPSSVIWHKNASSSGGSGSTMHEYYQTRNRLHIGMRYAPIRTKIALLKEGVHILRKSSSIRKKAVWDALIGRGGMYHG